MKKLKVLVTALIVSFAVAAGGMTFVAAGTASAAEDAPNRVMPAISVNNGEFASSSGSSGALGEATDWTGAFSGAGEDAGVYRGVVDTAAVDYGAAGFKDEATVNALRAARLTHKSKAANDSDTHALLIHNSVESVYQYTSSEFTIPANGYLTVSFDVFTGDFPSGQAAYVSFSADEFRDLEFEIETGREWQTFTFAIRGYRYRTVTTSLRLGVGRSVTADEVTTVKGAKGYAFFDSVELLLHTPDQFDYFYGDEIGGRTEGIVHAGSTKIWLAEENETQPMRDPSFVGDVGDWAADGSWRVEESSARTQIFTGVSSALTRYTYGGEALADPFAPFSAGGADNKILSVQSDDGGSAAITTADDNLLTLPRFGYARLSVWVNMVNAKKDTAITLTLATDDDYAEKSGTITSVAAQDENSWTEGWGEAVFLIKGSAFDARRLRLTLAVNGLYGAVSFDNVACEILTGEQYGALSGGTTVEMDATSDTVPNGSFNAFKVAGKDDVLAPAANWTAEAGEDAIGGVAPLDDYFAGDEFASARQKLALGATERPAMLNGKRNALLIRHIDDNYSSYKSESISAPASDDAENPDPYHLIRIQIASWLDAGDYAALELYANDVKVAEFPRVNTTGNANFVTYTFSVKIDTAKAPTYAVKLVAGTEAAPVKGSVWVNNVWIGKATAAAAGLNVRSVALDTTMFDAVSGDGPYYDNFVWEKVSEAGGDSATQAFVKTKEYDGSAYSAALKEMFAGAQSAYGMYLAADNPASIGLRHTFDVSFTENTFVKVTARIKTRGFDAGTGARFTLGAYDLKKINTEYLRENELTAEIVNGSDYRDGVYAGWREYSFYVNVGSTTGQTAQLTVWLGDGAKPSERRTGRVLVDSVTVAAITETEYNEATAVFDEYDKDDEEHLPTNALRVVLSETKDDPGSNTPNADVSGGGLNPWVIPSVLFGVAVLIAIAGFILKKATSRPRKRPVQKGLVSYDRNNRPDLPKRGENIVGTEDADENEADNAEIDYNAPLVHTPFAEELPASEPDAAEETTAAAEQTAHEPEARPTAEEETAEPVAASEPDAPVEKPVKAAPSQAPGKDFDSFDD